MRILIGVVCVLLTLVISSSSDAQIHVGPGQLYPDLGSAAHARAIHAGDTVYIHAGTYTNSTYWIDSLIGAPDQWITIRPYQNDSVSINEQYTFHTVQYLRIQGLHFYGNDPTQASRVYHQILFDYDYVCYTANHDIIVENCSFRDLNNTGKQGTGACLKFTGTDRFQVLNCVFKDGTNITDGVSLNGNRNGIISNCTFENMPGDGSHCKGGTKNMTYEKNLFINCAAGGLDVGGDTGPAFFCPLGAAWEADSIKVYSNIFIGGSTGIRLSSCHNSDIYNNTCFKSTQFAFRSLNASSNNITLANNRIYNNIFTTYSPNHIYLNASAGGDYTTEYFSNNLFHDYKNADPATINWSELPGVNVSNSLIGDPMFVDTASRNFRLREGSPAIGEGITLEEPSTDYYGRSFAASRSIGAIESGIASVLSESQHEFTIAPNPATNVIDVTATITDAQCIVVVDLSGREVMRVHLTGSAPVANQISTATLPSGNYVVSLMAKDGHAIAQHRLAVIH